MKEKKYEEKLAIVLAIRNGGSIEEEVRRHRVARTKVERWLSIWDEQGEEGLRTICQNTKRLQFREKMVRMVNKGIPLPAVCNKYKIAPAALRKWVEIVQRGGYSRLADDFEVGEYLKLKAMGRPKKREPQTELEKLQQENLMLKAENAMLKKLKALAMERDQRESLMQSKKAEKGQSQR